MFILYTLKGKLNKILKYLFSSTNIIPTYLSKESKLIKWGQQKNKPIKSSHVKKNNIKIIRKNKTLFYSTLIELTFQMVFFYWNIYILKKIIFILFKMLFYQFIFLK